MTPIYLERREPARNRQRFYVILGHPDPVRRLGAHPGVGPDRSSGDGAGKVVCDGREADAAGEQWRQRKEKQGCHLTNWA